MSSYTEEQKAEKKAGVEKKKKEKCQNWPVILMRKYVIWLETVLVSSLSE